MNKSELLVTPSEDLKFGLKLAETVRRAAVSISSDTSGSVCPRL